MRSGDPGSVDGGVASADDGHFLADLDVLAQVDVAQEIDGIVDTLELFARDAHLVALMGADAYEYGFDSPL